MYVDIGIKGKSVKAMIDTSATHNFMVDIKVIQLCLTMVKDQGKLKIVKSKALATSGMAKLVSCKMGPWNGNISFIVAPLDDFDLVLGLDFLTKA